MRARAAGARLGLAVVVLWGAVTVGFAALQLMDGGTLDLILGTSSQATPEVRRQIIADYGLDRSVPEQYATYLWHVLHGDLGRSYQLRVPVSEAIGDQLPATLALTSCALALAVVVAVVVALLTAHRAPWLRGGFAATETVALSVPQFWFGTLLLIVFSFTLRLFPAAGGLALPAVALAVTPAGMLAQVLRKGLEDALDEPFVVTARARGLGDGAVRLRHALRHALLPAVTLTGWLIGTTLGGAVVVEQVFSRPGIGRLTLTAVTNKDMPVVMGVVLVAALVYVTCSLAVDVLYRLIDPRLRTEAAA
ncbi:MULTISPECIES: ABC transporter permease [Thermomonosporaceae]|uniref:ABC transporter permease n=1 Tax=Thermomonosporaceae TaxID=2012 RepID=UPI00255A762A|nr:MULTISPECIES: ABC transporter permease [Thermomonosporaceae]MDL4771543.1 ABC transporter permease [Actinomadura xylanilytica]